MWETHQDGPCPLGVPHRQSGLMGIKYTAKIQELLIPVDLIISNINLKKVKESRILKPNHHLK